MKLLASDAVIPNVSVRYVSPGLTNSACSAGFISSISVKTSSSYVTRAFECGLLLLWFLLVADDDGSSYTSVTRNRTRPSSIAWIVNSNISPCLDAVLVSAAVLINLPDKVGGGPVTYGSFLSDNLRPLSSSDFPPRIRSCNDLQIVDGSAFFALPSPLSSFCFLLFSSLSPSPSLSSSPSPGRWKWTESTSIWYLYRRSECPSRCLRQNDVCSHVLNFDWSTADTTVTGR
mmetsp:Transcript_4499/g.11311  ORF Transcript_4499/g.11311 Transcript_4499/m.11311 type:complete len:231 (+) Transcript_4499:2626-3318(+)